MKTVFLFSLLFGTSALASDVWPPCRVEAQQACMNQARLDGYDVIADQRSAVETQDATNYYVTVHYMTFRSEPWFVIYRVAMNRGNCSQQSTPTNLSN